MLEWLKVLAQWSGETARPARMVITNRWSKLSGGQLYWLLALFLGTGAGLAGPFGMFGTMPTWVSVLYWQISMVASFAIWSSIRAMLLAWKPNYPTGWIDLTMVLPFSLANAGFVFGMIFLLASLFGQDPWTSYVSLVTSHLVFSLVVVLPTIAVIRRLLNTAEVAGRTDVIDFLTEKLPPQLRAMTPFAIAAEGPYVRVYTAKGDDLVSMRFEDAMRAVQGIEGVQTHRSWWVAIAEVEGLTASGSAYEATLRSGQKVPVSRRRKKAVDGALV